MIREQAEIAILGGGFAGSLMSLVLNKIGRVPIVIEKGRHPKFAIGESSTPLANLILENLCQTYGLDRLSPLAKYGSWRRHRPELACGLKRGFSFFKHDPGQPFSPGEGHANELLVTASPSDDVGDTHWYRSHFDHFLTREVQYHNVGYLDGTTVRSVEYDNGWTLLGLRGEEEVKIQAPFLIDATGGGLEIKETPNFWPGEPRLNTRSWSVYSHFEDVAHWRDVLGDLGGQTADHPFRCDDAALHHILDEGWIWVLRFNNGITSAGIVFDGAKRPGNSDDPQDLWHNTLARYPSIARQFEKARPIRRLVKTKRLQRRVSDAAGLNWVMLPHSAYFIDPLLSAGNAHTLLGVERLARILEQHWAKPSLADELQAYSKQLQREIDFLDKMIHGCYQLFTNFELFTTFSMYYFAGAIQSEHRRQHGLASEDDEFIFSHHPPFRSALFKSYMALSEMCAKSGKQSAAARYFMKTVGRDIEPFNVAGLCDPGKLNMYPYLTST